MKIAYLTKSIFVLIIGIILLTIGFTFFFKKEPQIAINLRFLQLVIVNGSLEIILGLGFIIGGIYTFINRTKLTKDETSRRKYEGKAKSKGFKHIS
jgi:hypothetical protein